MNLGLISAMHTTFKKVSKSDLSLQMSNLRLKAFLNKGFGHVRYFYIWKQRLLPLQMKIILDEFDSKKVILCFCLPVSIGWLVDLSSIYRNNFLIIDDHNFRA